VTCGYDHTLALTNKGEIYAWGNNDYGQIGDNKWKPSDPIKVTHELLMKHFNNCHNEWNKEQNDKKDTIDR